MTMAMQTAFMSILNAGITRVAGAAGIGKSGLCQELDVLFLQDAMQVCGDANIGAQLLDGCDGCISGFGIIHLVNAGHAHSLADCAVTLARSEERRVGKECRSRWSPYH